MVKKQAEVCRNFELDWLACAQGDEETGRIDADYIVFKAKGDIEQLRKLVPAPLEATDEVIIYMGWFKETEKEGTTTWAWPFHEWGIGVVSKYKDGTESRRGTQLVSARADNLQPVDADEFPFVGRQHAICFRQVPSPDSVAVEKQQLVFVQLDFETTDVRKGTGEITINDGPFDQIPIGPLTDVVAYFGRSAFNHRGINNLVVDAEELARPLDHSKAGKTPATV
jgi:hypothetical protein